MFREGEVGGRLLAISQKQTYNHGVCRLELRPTKCCLFALGGGEGSGGFGFWAKFGEQSCQDPYLEAAVLGVERRLFSSRT